MKKILFVAVIAFGFSVSSCVKDYNCHCVGTSTIEGDTSDVDYTYAQHGTKKDATNKCAESSEHHKLADITCTLAEK